MLNEIVFVILFMQMVLLLSDFFFHSEQSNKTKSEIKTKQKFPMFVSCDLAFSVCKRLCIFLYTHIYLVVGLIHLISIV